SFPDFTILSSYNRVEFKCARLLFESKFRLLTVEELMFRSMELDPTYVKGFYRRADAHLWASGSWFKSTMNISVPLLKP
ncbi:hypothetical protein HUJ05_002585, partial [Dendroctonus ponderosae]